MTDELKQKVEASIARLQMFQPPEGYWLAFSGGKDSVVIKRIADMAGINYTAHYQTTSVDPPELVYFIRENHPDVIIDIPKDKDGKQISMWSLIREKGLPTRWRRFCCAYLKENASNGHMVITGVRWAESKKRADNQGIVTLMDNTELGQSGNPDFRYTDRKGSVLVNDNDESRRIVEQCYKKGRVTVNPIVEWSDSDVWDFIRDQRLPVCSLYFEGYHRLGCIGCPLAGGKVMAQEFARYPKYAKLYRRAIGKWIDKMVARDGGEWMIGNKYNLHTVDEWWHWWLQDRSIDQEVLPGFEDDYEDN